MKDIPPKDVTPKPKSEPIEYGGIGPEDLEGLHISPEEYDPPPRPYSLWRGLLFYIGFAVVACVVAIGIVAGFFWWIG